MISMFFFFRDIYAWIVVVEISIVFWVLIGFLDQIYDLLQDERISDGFTGGFRWFHWAV